MNTPRDDLDGRLDHVIEAATRPRADAAFRARVVAAIDGSQPGRWLSWHVALAMAGMALVAAGGAGAWWRPVDAPPVQQVRQEQPAPAATEPRAAETTTSTDVAAPPAEVRGEPKTSRRPAQAARERAARLLAAALDQEERIPRIVVPSVAVQALAVEPLGATPEFRALESPERVDVDPIVVEALDENR